MSETPKTGLVVLSIRPILSRIYDDIAGVAILCLSSTPKTLTGP